METKHHEHHHLFSDDPDVQMSEAFVNSAFLALSGGFQDAYTYNVRDEVFSNAQTGNVVLMSQSLMSGEWMTMLHYLIPVIAFTLGVLVTEQIQYRYKYAKRIHWRQTILLIEVLILFIVGFIPEEYNIAATVLVSFTCAMQVQGFRKVGGYAYASTMCIGNLRSGVDALSVYMRERKLDQLRKCGHYFAIIFMFALGAGVGGVLSVTYGISVIWICCILLMFSYFLMSLEKYRDI